MGRRQTSPHGFGMLHCKHLSLGLVLKTGQDGPFFPPAFPHRLCCHHTASIRKQMFLLTPSNLPLEKLTGYTGELCAVYSMKQNPIYIRTHKSAILALGVTPPCLKTHLWTWHLLQYFRVCRNCLLGGCGYYLWFFLQCSVFLITVSKRTSSLLLGFPQASF